MDTVEHKPIILFYNPQCAKPGYQRLPAAILQIASIIEGVYSYEIIDGNLYQETDHAKAIILKVERGGAKYLAISIMPGPQLKSTIKDLRIIKRACPELVVIVGGYFPLIHPELCAKDPDIDYVVVGPGEVTFKELIDAKENGRPVDNIPGIAFWRDDSFRQAERRSPVEPDNLPRYPYHRLDVEKYVVPTFLGTRTLSHHSSFGCPFSCNFCGVVALARGKWLGENGQRLGELTRYLVERWNINALEFHDNNFFVSEKRVQDFCRQLIDHDIKITWWGEGRVDTLYHFRDETWALMKDSGLKMVFMGAESGDDDTLKRMNKGGSQSGRLILLLAGKMKRFGIIPEFSFILGNPPDPRKNIKDGIEFIRRLKKTNSQAEIIIYRYDPVPIGGELFENVTKLGFAFPDTLEEWTRTNWSRIQQRKSADVPWLRKQDQVNISEFQAVLNAYYPTSTARNITHRSWCYYLLKLIGGIRYYLHWYKKPVELHWLQKRLAHQRPEISGF